MYKINQHTDGISTICAGIVTCNPNMERLYKNINAISLQVTKIVVIDNGSKNIDEIEKLVNLQKNVSLVSNSKNEGIAKALNQIFEWADNNNFSWVLTLDQDSICESNMINIFLNYINCANIGIICPKIDYTNYIRKKDDTRNKIDYVEACMTSASLTSLQAWKDCMGYDEWMFIDYVDNDFCMRLKLNNYKIIRINEAILHHNLGNAETKIIGPFRVTVFNHSSFRNYYYVRNSIYFIRKYKKHINFIKYILILIYWESKKLLFELEKKKTINSFVRGFIDGMKVKL